MVNRKTASALAIAALLSCAIPARSVTSRTVPIIAQAAPSFPVPVSADENVRVSSSSDNMNAISAALAAGFEGKYDGEVKVETKSASAALADVLNGSADVAAISRPLTAAEKAQGLVETPVRREKIAIIVGEANPFNGSITSSQFAQIFRGEITNWSEVGGGDSPIRVVDRPDSSETRQALQPYPVFVSQALATGDNATQVDEDSTATIAEELGADGISYALVGEVGDRASIRAIELHKTLPDDPRYPFSQPYSFVYADDASPAAAAFLGYATGGEGQAALQAADLSGYGVAPAATTAGAEGASELNAEAANAESDGLAAVGSESDGAGSDDAANANDSDGDANRATSTPADGLIGSLNDAGQLVDADNNLISPEGFLIDADGNLIDSDGNLLPEGAAGVPGVGLNLDGTGSAIDNVDSVASDAVEETSDLAERGRWWWLLLPLAGLGLLIWAAGRRGSEEEAGYSATASGTTDDRVRNSFRGKMPTVNTPDANLSKVGSGANLGAVEADGIKTSVGNAGNQINGIGKAGLAGAAGIAGGAAAGAAGLASQMKRRAGDAVTGVGEASSSLKSGADNVQSAATGGLGNLRSDVQGRVQGTQSDVSSGIDSVRTNVQGRIDNARTDVQGRVQGSIDGIEGGTERIQPRTQASFDGAKASAQEHAGNLRSNAKSSVDGFKSNVQGHAQGHIDSAREAANDAKSSANQSSWLERAKQRINEAADGVKDTAADIKDDLKRKG